MLEEMAVMVLWVVLEESEDLLVMVELAQTVVLEEQLEQEVM